MSKERVEIGVSFRGFGYIEIYTEDGETLEDLKKMSDDDLIDRIPDLEDIFDFVDCNKIKIDGVRSVCPNKTDTK